MWIETNKNKNLYINEDEKCFNCGSQNKIVFINGNLFYKNYWKLRLELIMNFINKKLLIIINKKYFVLSN